MSNGEHGNLVGIDLGTTFSVIAQLDAKGNVTTISNKEGAPRTPSVVYLDGTNAFVGDAAKKAAANSSDKVAMFIKREIGRGAYSRTIDGRSLRTETLSAIILRKLKQDAEKRIGPISKAVITVPAFFDESRRQATQDAGRIAGLNVVDIINEPTAAALAYALQGRGNRVGAPGTIEFPKGYLTALVYDLGGGTFDVTVVKLATKRFETLATDGAVELGGKDWDDKIIDYIAQEFQKRFGRNPLDDDKDRLRSRYALAAAAEEAKTLLSDLPATQLSFTYAGNELQLTLTREQFEAMTRDKLAQTQILSDLVVQQQAKLQWSQIDRVLLVGGSTKMPQVKAMLKRVTGREPDDSLDPDQVVAHGAAIHAGIVASAGQTATLEVDDDVRDDLREVQVFPVNAYSLGVDAFRNGRLISRVIIPKNTQLPFAASQVFRTTQTGATVVQVVVREGEAEEADHNIRIGECLVSGISPDLPAKSPIQVRLAYLANGLIDVTGLDMTTGKIGRTEIRRQSGMTEADILRETAFVAGLTIR